jgi:glycosyltransferase involved in cell wall biosynthesis
LGIDKSIMKKPLKILYFENAIGWSGAAICLKLIAEYLDKDKYYPIITTPHMDGNYSSYKHVAKWYYIPDKKIDKTRLTKNIDIFNNKIGLRNEKLSKRIASWFDYIFNLLPYLQKIFILARKEKIDLIHLNNEPVCNMAGVIIAKLFHIPCIAHVRGPVTWDSITARLLYKNVSYVITVADWVRQNVLNLGIDEEKVETINDGRNLEEFISPFDRESTRKSLGLHATDLSVGIVGIIIPWKGHKVFIDAAKIVGEKHPDCKMLIIGKSPAHYKEYENELKELVEKQNIKNVFFTGHRNEIQNVMRVLDIVVNASVEPDPYPNVVIEGMASGKAVIASQLGGPLEMIDNHKTGILIEPGNPVILASTISELLSDCDLRSSLGREARKVAFQKWSIENHVKQIEGVYERILGTI